MPRPASRASSRPNILDAAAELIAQHGVHDLTLEGVAYRAGVTKGGLIYHFKTKDDLLAAVVERVLIQVEERYRSRAERHGNTLAARLSSLVEETFDFPEDEKRLQANLLAAASSYPHLLGPVQAMFARIYGQFSEAGANTGLALVLAAALDGIVFLELQNLHHFAPDEREAMRQAILTISRQLS